MNTDNFILFLQSGQFTRIEYLSTFIGLIYALGVTQALRGLAVMLVHKGWVTFDYRVLFWSIFILYSLMYSWYYFWLGIILVEKAYWMYILLCLKPISYIFLVSIILPVHNIELDLKENFDNKRRLYYAIWVGLSIFTFFSVYLMGGDVFWPPRLVVSSSHFIMSILTFVFNNKRWDFYSVVLHSLILVFATIVFSIGGVR